MKKSQVKHGGPEQINPVAREAIDRIVDLPVGPAEKALAALADRCGDEAAKQVVAGLSPIKIAAMLDRGDFSVPTALGWFIDPDQAVAVLKKAPLFWRQVRNFRNRHHYQDIQADALDFLTGLLLGEDNPARLEARLDLINWDEAGRNFLILPFIGWTPGPDQLIDYEWQEVDPGTVEHLFEAIRWAGPDAAEAILDYLDSTDVPLDLYIFDLWSEALADFETGRDYTALEEAMFSQLN